MRVLLFGATGMVGAGVLRECLRDARVTSVLAIVRSPTGLADPKLEELRHADLFDLAAVAPRFADRDACFFCAGVSSAGLGEPAYRRLTLDMTLAAARAASAANPAMTFCYVSGQGTAADSRMMWARVKAATEDAILALPFKAAFMFRPGYIQPPAGIVSRTRWYRLFYMVMGPLYPLLRAAFPWAVTSSEAVGRAMLAVAAGGHPVPVLETADINRVAGR